MSTISYDEFERTYEPVKNQLDSNASYNGCMFETFGEELEQVQMVIRREPGRVWTIIDGDDGVCIVNGAHFVNRLGYLVTKVPAETASITVEDE